MHKFAKCSSTVVIAIAGTFALSVHAAPSAYQQCVRDYRGAKLSAEKGMMEAVVTMDPYKLFSSGHKKRKYNEAVLRECFPLMTAEERVREESRAAQWAREPRGPVVY